jgi:hypothetical protein
MNNSSPPVLSKSGQENQCALLENVYYSYNSGKIRTRWPFRRYSTTTLSGSVVDGLTVYDGEFLLSSGQKLFYLDAGKVPHYIGATGSEPPCMVSFNGKLLIGSNTTPQTLSTARALANLTGTGIPTTVKQFLEERAYIWACGDSTYPDRIYRSVVNNEATFSGDGTAYYDMGFKDDDLVAIGMMNGPNNNIVVWKRGNSKKATWFFQPSDTAPVARLTSTIYSARTWRGACWAANKLWFMDDFSPLAIAGTDTVDQLVIDPASMEIGSRISSTWAATDDSFCVVYPPDAQIWFFNPPKRDIWVLNYRDYAWYKFKPAGSLIFYSAYYHPTLKKLYLGGNDGYVYVYETSGAGDYQDNPGGVDTDYTQKIVTKLYNLYPKYYHEIKEPMVNYLGLKAGSGYFRINKKWGSVEALSEVLTISLSYPRAYSYIATLGYDARTTKAWASQMQSSLKDFNLEADNFQIALEVNSGALEFHDLSFIVSKTNKLTS